MDVEGVVDEVLEIERTMQMDMAELPIDDSEEGNLINMEPSSSETTTVEDEAIDTVGTSGELEEQSPVERSSDSEGSPPMDGQDVTFVVQLNDEGGIMLDKSGVVPTDAEPHVYFPITLPAVKIRSSENPLVGAKHFPTTRSRKTKPQAILYNDEIDQIYEMLPDGSLNTITTSGGQNISNIPDTTSLGEPMDVIDFESRLLPKDFELMERVLANAKEVLEIPTTSSVKPSTSREYRLDSEEVHYDHSYCAYPLYQIVQSRYKGKSKITILPEIRSETTSMESSSARSDDFDVLRLDGTLNPNLWEIPPQVDTNDRVEGLENVDFDNAEKEDVKKTSDSEEATPDTKSKLTPTANTEDSTPTPSDATNARSRRSQRQQDRIERQEAERIMAENQQMLQREKEIFGGKCPISPSQPITPGNETPQPAAVAAIPETTPVMAEGVPKVEDETPSTSTRRPYPKRQNRKLPAHLADPNYINLDEPVLKSHENLTDREAKTKTETVDDASEEKEINEDDPNKLWCICKKPHNNRFMICCDTCEDWFHGKCVGVTKAVGSKLDKWICPNCRKKEMNVKETLQTPVAKISRKSKGAAASGTRRGNGAKALENANTPVASKKQSLSVDPKEDQNHPSPEKLRQRRITDSSGDLSNNDTPPAQAPGKCIICKTKPTRQSSVFCSDECVVKHSQEASGPTPTAVPAAASKLKRSNSKVVADKEELENFLTFHLISPGVTKSTVVVPPKPKDGVASNQAKSPTKSSSISESSSSTSSTNGKASLSTSSVNSTSTNGGKRVSEPQVSPTEVKRTKLVEAARLPTKRGIRPSTSSTVRKAGSTDGTRQPRKRVTSGGDKGNDKGKVKDKKETEVDISTFRQTSRSKLTEVFERRLKELTETERAEIPVTNTPDKLSMEIEAELYNTYANASVKYRSKFRSILFNLSDSKNNFYKKISTNELSAKQVVKLESHQLASDELTQWRLNESKKELEMIKRSEIDKLEELKNQERIDAELGFEPISAATAAGDEGRFLGISHVEGKLDGSSIIPKELTPIKVSTRSSPRHKSHHHSSKSGETQLTKVNEDSPKKRESDASTSSHRRTRSSDHKDNKDEKPHKSETEKRDRRSVDHRKSSSSGKHSSSHDKEKESPTKQRESTRSLRSREHSLRSSDRKRSHSETENRKESSRENDKSRKNESQTATSKKNQASRDGIAPVSTSTMESLTSDKNETDGKDGRDTSTVASSIDQEQPSSTIKTPDFTAEEANAQPVGNNEAQKPVLSSKFTMPELGSFNAKLYNVSHFALDGIFFPTSPVPIVGRIAPSTVWDYIDKMKKTKEVIILRLAPATQTDTEGYMTFFTYFSSRTRLGVLGGISSPLKDVYLVPLDKHSPVNNALLPLHGPGLPRKRAHCLLAVITRNFVDGVGQISRRKLSTSSESSPKRMKLNAEIKPGLISSLNLNSARQGRSSRSKTSKENDTKKSPDEKISPDEQNSEMNEDDLPYTPWEEEEGNSPNTEISDPLKTTSTEPIDPNPKIIEQLKDLEAQIQQEQAAIENISMSLIASSKVPLAIPGLDGEFSAETAVTAPLQFLHQLPLITESSTPNSKPVAQTLLEEKSKNIMENDNEKKSVREDDSAPYSPSQLDLDEESGS